MHALINAPRTLIYESARRRRKRVRHRLCISCIGRACTRVSKLPALPTVLGTIVLRCLGYASKQNILGSKGDGSDGRRKLLQITTIITSTATTHKLFPSRTQTGTPSACVETRFREICRHSCLGASTRTRESSRDPTRSRKPHVRIQCYGSTSRQPV